MRRSAGILILLLALLLLAYSQAHGEEPQDPPPYAAGRILVKLRPGTTVRGFSSGRVIPEIGVVSLPVVEGQELEAARRLSGQPEVEFAEPNYLVTAFKTPNDSFFSFYQWNLRTIRAEAAWDIEAGKESVTIAILDTGVDLAHPDLASKVLPGLNLLDESSPPQDDNGHGSHVAGIAAAASNNGLGIAGVSWGAKVLPVKVLDSLGLGTVEDLARAIIWAADQGARAINISGGTLGPSQTLQAAVDYAHEVKGALVVAAVGNEGGFGGFNPPQYPAAFPKVLAVAATDSNDRRADFSERGPYVDVAAPGVTVLGPVLRGQGEPAFGGDYQQLSGTSMAAPHVAGLAALIWSANPALTNEQVARLVENAAQDLGPPGKDQLFGSGRIDAYAAVRAATTGILTASTGSLTALSDMANRQGVTLTVSLANLGGVAFDWTAAISPTVSWLALSPTSGRLEALGPSQTLTIATRPLGIAEAGTYSTTVFLSGQGNVQKSPAAVPVTLRVLERLEKLFFPWVATSSQGGW